MHRSQQTLPIQRRFTVSQAQPLLAHLLTTLGLRRREVKNLLKFGAVQVNGATVRQFDHLLSAGDEVTVGNMRTAAATSQLQKARIRIVYEDEALIVVDKPSGLLTVATDQQKAVAADTLYTRLNRYLRDRSPARATRALVVHRLDRETSGLVVFATNESVKKSLQDAWTTVEKIYLAIVDGRPSAAQGTLKNYLTEDQKALKVSASDRPKADSRLAITHYRVLETRGARSLIEVRLETGRKHQIRVHLAGLGTPVIGDKRYGQKSTVRQRLALHASQLRLVHPLTGEELNFSSPLPGALRRLLG